jgi:hypothetical protein
MIARMAPENQDQHELGHRATGDEPRTQAEGAAPGRDGEVDSSQGEERDVDR